MEFFSFSYSNKALAWGSFLMPDKWIWLEKKKKELLRIFFIVFSLAYLLLFPWSQLVFFYTQPNTFSAWRVSPEVCLVSKIIPQVPALGFYGILSMLYSILVFMNRMPRSKVFSTKNCFSSVSKFWYLVLSLFFSTKSFFISSLKSHLVYAVSF